MSEPGHESTLGEFYRELPPADDGPSADDSVRRVVDRARSSPPATCWDSASAAWSA